MRRIWLLAVVGALLTAACSFEANILIELNEDGSGSVGIEVGLGGPLAQQAIAEGELDMTDLMDDLASAPGATVDQRVEGDTILTEVTFPFSSPEEFDTVMASFSGGDGVDLDVQWADDGVSISGTLEGSGEDGLGFGGLGDLGDLGDLGGLEGLGDLGDLGGLEGLGDLGDLGGLEGFDLDNLEDMISASVIVSMPGDIDTHNATRVLADGRLQWDVPLDGTNLDISAQSTFGGGGFPVWLIVLLALAALVVIAVIYSRQQRRSTAVAAIEAAGDAPEATDDGLIR